MKLPLFIVDSFAESIGNGGPAGVVVCKGEMPSSEEMKLIAREVGKSETAFVVGMNGKYQIRWFSPNMEMPLCGHATLAASKVLTEIFGEVGELEFRYVNGALHVKQDSDGIFRMDFPLDNYKEVEYEEVYTNFFGNIKTEKVIRGENTKKTVLIVNDETNLRSIMPNFGLMKTSQGFFYLWNRYFKKGEKYDIESRYFNPWSGVDEDQVTGSVHTLLGRYWSEALGKNQIVALQDSDRPGVLSLMVGENRIEIGGKAVIAINGEIEI